MNTLLIVISLLLCVTFIAISTFEIYETKRKGGNIIPYILEFSLFVTLLITSVIVGIKQSEDEALKNAYHKGVDIKVNKVQKIKNDKIVKEKIDTIYYIKGE